MASRQVPAHEGMKVDVDELNNQEFRVRKMRHYSKRVTSFIIMAFWRREAEMRLRLKEVRATAVVLLRNRRMGEKVSTFERDCGHI